MKFSRLKILYIALFATFTLNSCEKAEIIAPTPIQKETRKADANTSAAPIIVSSAAYNSIGFPLTITNFTIEDEIIMLTATHNGGCAETFFMLTADGTIGNNGGTSVVDVKLIKTKNDGCKKITSQSMKFDLSPLHSLATSPMILNIDGVGQIVYSY